MTSCRRLDGLVQSSVGSACLVDQWAIVPIIERFAANSLTGKADGLFLVIGVH